jgi:hypothetical protein
VDGPTPGDDAAHLDRRELEAIDNRQELALLARSDQLPAVEESGRETRFAEEIGLGHASNGEPAPRNPLCLPNPAT